MAGWMERKKNSNNSHYLLKPWLVCISQAWPTVTAPLPYLIRKETETNTWIYNPGLFFSKGQAFSTTHDITVSTGQTNSRMALFPVPALCPSTDTWNQKGDKQMLS